MGDDAKDQSKKDSRGMGRKRNYAADRKGGLGNSPFKGDQDPVFHHRKELYAGAVH